MGTISQELKWSAYSSETEVMDKFEWARFYAEHALLTGIYIQLRREWQPTPIFFLENPMDREAWWATFHVVAKNRPSTHTHTHTHTHRVQISSVQLLSRVRLFATPWIAARQASLSITISQSLLKLISIERGYHPTISSSVILSSSCLQSFPSLGCFQMSQFFASGGQSIGVSASTSVLLMNI